MGGHNVAPMKQSYERLTVLRRSGSDRARGAMYLVQCSCGSPPFRTHGWSLRAKKTRSCGCLRDEKSAARLRAMAAASRAGRTLPSVHEGTTI